MTAAPEEEEGRTSFTAEEEDTGSIDDAGVEDEDGAGEATAAIVELDTARTCAFMSVNGRIGTRNRSSNCEDEADGADDDGPCFCSMNEESDSSMQSSCMFICLLCVGSIVSSSESLSLPLLLWLEKISLSVRCDDTDAIDARRESSRDSTPGPLECTLSRRAFKNCASCSARLRETEEEEGVM